MTRDALTDRYTAAKMLAISGVVVLLLFIWQGNKGFSLWDEGFLWYGVQRVMLGEVPIRDFMAYDPGRYYWSAALLSIVGNNGIIALRATIAIFQALGLFVGLLVIAQSARREGKGNTLFLLLSAAILVVWMFPEHKLFDISLSIFLIGILTYLIRNPIPKRYFFTGICIGLVAVFGRNHGVYGALASLGVIGWLSIKSRTGTGFLKGAFLWGAGVAVGFLPIVLMALFIPGFGTAFWESVRFLFEQKNSFLPLPVPWPWKINFAALSFHQALRAEFIGLFFVGILVFGAFAILWVIRQRLKERPVPAALVASAFLAIPYANVAFSRAEINHLAQGSFPLLVGCLVLLSCAAPKVKWPLVAGLCVVSFLVMLPAQPGWECRSPGHCVSVEISGSNLMVDPGTAADIALLRRLAAQYAPNGQTFIAAPYWPGAYALLERKAPMWEIYPLFPRSAAFQEREIERMKAAKPGFAIIFDMPLDGRDSVRFRNSHPIIQKYIENNFERVPDAPNPAYQIYKAKVPTR
jgi:hypothetical protein